MRIFLILFALLWLVAAGAFVWWRNPDAVVAMTPAEWGEFLGGVFGPLGFVAVLVTLIQQGSDLKEQRQQIEKQLSMLEQQIKAQVSQANEAAKQADAAASQATLAIERMMIERIRNQAGGLAMMAVRYASRLRTSDADTAIPVIGAKEELSDDLKLGPEAVMETVRLRLRESTQRIKNEGIVLSDVASRSRLDDLTAYLFVRVGEVQAAFATAEGVPEIDRLKKDMGLAFTKKRLAELREVLGLPPVESVGAKDAA